MAYDTSTVKHVNFVRKPLTTLPVKAAKTKDDLVARMRSGRNNRESFLSFFLSSSSSRPASFVRDKKNSNRAYAPTRLKLFYSFTAVPPLFRSDSSFFLNSFLTALRSFNGGDVLKIYNFNG